MTAPPRRPNVANLHLVALAFVAFGATWGTWAVAAADIERELSLSHAMLGLLFSSALAGAAAANIVGGVLTERRGTAQVLAWTLAVWGSLTIAASLTHRAVAFSALLIALITVGGLLDVVMNVAATAGLAHRPGALVRFHAFFNGAAALGAATTGLLLAHRLSWRWTWTGVGIGAWLIAAWTVRADLPAGGAGEQVRFRSALSLLRRERLVLIAVAFALAAMVENGTELWGVLLLRTQLPSGLVVGASSAVVGYAIAAAARVLLGPLAGRRGPARGVMLGTIAATVGIATLAIARVAWIAGAGLVLAAGGISMCWPLLLAYASGSRERPAAVIGAVTATGYVGFIVGPTLVGALANAAGLRVGVLLLAAAAVFVGLIVRVTER